MTDIVLILGLVCDAEVWRHQTKYLKSEAKLTVPAVREGATMADMARGVLAEAPEEFALAGFSMGGYIALEILRQAPARITKLALLDTSARTDTPEKSFGRNAAILACERGEYPLVIDAMMKILLHPSRQAEPLADFVATMAQRVGSEIFARRHRAMATRLDARDILAAAHMPVRIICGRQDAMCTLEEHQEMADLTPKGRLSIIEECGHMTILERPQAATALLRDWLLYD